MQRRLICKTKQCGGGGYATLPGGKPYLMGRAPLRFPFTYTDASCGFPTTLSAAEFNSLPPVSMAELDTLGELERLTKDLRGAGYEVERQTEDGRTVRPVEDLFAVGLTSPAKVEARIADATPKDEPKSLQSARKTTRV